MTLFIQASNSYLYLAEIVINDIPSLYVFPPEVEFDDDACHSGEALNRCLFCLLVRSHCSWETCLS